MNPVPAFHLDPALRAVDVIPESVEGMRVRFPLSGLVEHPDHRLSRVVVGRAFNESGEWVGVWLNHSRDHPTAEGRFDCEGYLRFQEPAAGQLIDLTIDAPIVCDAPGCGFYGRVLRGVWWQHGDLPRSTVDVDRLLAQQGATLTGWLATFVLICAAIILVWLILSHISATVH